MKKQNAKLLLAKKVSSIVKKKLLKEDYIQVMEPILLLLNQKIIVNFNHIFAKKV